MLGQMNKTFFVYIMASKPRGVLYVGLTSNLPRRAWQHREHVQDGFTKKYWVDRLVYYEHHESAESGNPTWADLFDTALRDHGLDPEA